MSVAELSSPTHTSPLLERNSWMSKIKFILVIIGIISCIRIRIWEGCNEPSWLLPTQSMTILTPSQSAPRKSIQRKPGVSWSINPLILVVCQRSQFDDFLKSGKLFLAKALRLLNGKSQFLNQLLIALKRLKHLKLNLNSTKLPKSRRIPCTVEGRACWNKCETLVTSCPYPPAGKMFK